MQANVQTRPGLAGLLLQLGCACLVGANAVAAVVYGTAFVPGALLQGETWNSTFTTTDLAITGH